MSKVFQILNNLCHWDASAVYSSVSSIPEGVYDPSILFVDAPDNIFEGYGYINGEFILPTPPPGWALDENTGTFYMIEGE